MRGKQNNFFYIKFTLTHGPIQKEGLEEREMRGRRERGLLASRPPPRATREWEVEGQGELVLTCM